MDLTAYVDDTLRRWPGPLPLPTLGWWPTWAGQSYHACRHLLRSAISAIRAQQARARLDQELQQLDDRLLRDIGIDPSTVRRPPSIEPGLWLINRWH